MAKVTFKIEGLKELEQALAQMKVSTAKGVVRRVLKKAAEPMAEAARGYVPVDQGDLRDSITVSTRLTRSARRRHQKQSPVEVYVGPNSQPASSLQEYGTAHSAPQPYMRPAWDGEKASAFDSLAQDLGAEIEKTAKRAARRSARLLRKG